MDKVKLDVDETGNGAFSVTEGSERIGEMVVSISGDVLTVYHTEVSSAAEGKGVAKEMLNAMVAYARENKKKVIPLCPYVHAQFKRHPNDFADLWEPGA